MLNVLKERIAAASFALCLALSKFGIDIEAKTIIIATTIIISTKVKPDLLFGWLKTIFWLQSLQVN